MYRSSHGFTLVELLVVITIIGFLMALIIPAVNMVRETGRQTKCLNNQRELGQAMIMYESAKNHFPGVLNQLQSGGSTVQYNWVEALFPYLEHGDMWEALTNANTASIAPMRLAIAVCPNDPYLADPTSQKAQALLSYGVNDQYFVDYRSNPPVDRNSKAVEPANRAKLTARPTVSFPRGQSVSPSSTIMIGERTGDGTVANPHVTGGGWVDQTWGSLTFQWPTAPLPPTAGALVPVPISPKIMVSAHPGIVVVVFFDGHGEKVPNDTVYPQ